MNVLVYPDPFLRRKVQPVKTITDELRRSILAMFPTMYRTRGVGLAATQVGLDAQVFVLNLTGKPEDEVVLINPEITATEGEIRETEGCLSLPGLEARVRRAGHVRVRALDLEGKPFEVEGSELLARVLQHEIDHLGGLLFVDKIGPAARIGLKGRLKEMEERYRQKVQTTETDHPAISGPELG